MDIKFYLSLFLRRLPWLVLLAGLGAMLGVAIALSLPPTYKARATLIVESEQIPDNLAESTVSTGEIEALQIIEQRIFARAVLLELANRLNVYAGVEDADAMSPDDKVADLRQRIAVRTVGGATGRGQAEATIVTVGFEARNPDLTARVANEIVTLILQENVRMRTAVAGQTLDFFTQEVDRLEQQLSEVSGRILEFQESNLESLPDSLDFRRSRQSALQERLLQMQRESNALNERREQLVTMFEENGDAAFLRNNARQMTPQEQRLSELQDQYNELSAVLSETNPRLTVLRNRITAAEAALSSTVSQTASEDGATGLSMFDIQLADIDSQIEYIDDQAATVQAQLDEISGTIEATPGNAVTLGSLNREYSNLQSQYNQAVANRARAEMGSTIETLSRGQRISIVEQAVRPNSPDSPDRPLIAIAGLGGGLALGIALIALLELLNTAIRRPQDLKSGLDIDTLATIPHIQTRAEIVRGRVKAAAIVLAFLIGVPALLWYVDRNVTPLQPRFADALASVQERLNL